MEWKKVENEMWMPETDGETIIGTLKDKTEGNYGPQWIIETNKGEIRTPSHKVLQNRLNRVEIGKEVKIVYVGEEKPKEGHDSPTKIYEVYTK